MKKVTAVRLDDEVRQRLRSIASERETTVSALVALAVDRFLRDETFRDELADMEQRLATTMVRALTETARVGDDVQLVIAQVDQLIRFMFQVTPEIFDKEAAAIVGSRRYTGFLESFATQFVGRKRRAVFAAEVDKSGADDGDGQ
ncbi:conserved hypothetical protein [Paraburkholderia tropica]|uniref:hypothetical protein n=1 Tax=Paraburkholderia tropica TaxID=92647 RepID=UPI001CAC9B3E|nr:hypothetical protein [Paraburkholderia tropica]CAG9229893.1 conserved hypothetical protein [Paraburkholderia tropica]